MRPSINQCSYWLKSLGKTSCLFCSSQLRAGPVPLDGDCIVVFGQNKNDRPTIFIVVSSLAVRRFIEVELERENVHTVDRLYEPKQPIVKIGVDCFKGRYKAKD